MLLFLFRAKKRKENMTNGKTDQSLLTNKHRAVKPVSVCLIITLYLFKWFKESLEILVVILQQPVLLYNVLGF